MMSQVKKLFNRWLLHKAVSNFHLIKPVVYVAYFFALRLHSQPKRTQMPAARFNF